MTVLDLLKKAVEQGASDVYIVVGRETTLRCNGRMFTFGERLLPKDAARLVAEIYELAHRSIVTLKETGDDDFALSIPGFSRFRVNAYRQRGSFSAVIRIIAFNLPDYQTLHIPDYVMQLANLRKGMVLVTGPAGNGKSSTLACIIDEINKTQEKHIITLEDPLEYLHRHKRSIVTQREMGTDTKDYVTALRAALRQSPNVILLGEMRDYETINVAMTAAETGHLIFSTLHTIGAANTIDRIIDVFPVEQQRQIAIQLSMVLSCVISQQLVPDVSGELIPAFEIMTVTPAIRNMIREKKIAQIEGQLYASAKEGMISMDQSLLALYEAGRITDKTALLYATNPEMMSKKLKG